MEKESSKASSSEYVIPAWGGAQLQPDEPQSPAQLKLFDEYRVLYANRSVIHRENQVKLRRLQQIMSRETSEMLTYHSPQPKVESIKVKQMIRR